MDEVEQRNWTLGNSNTNYKTKYDPKLLVRIDRLARRKDYSEMHGWDIWTAYEVSFLLPSGLPCFEVMRIWADCNSPYIFESKSLKLYLYSFNNTVFENKEEVIKTIAKDLTEVSGLPVQVELVNKMKTPSYYFTPELHLEYLYPACECKDLTYKPELLQTKEVKENQMFIYKSDLLRSNCEVTNQPDWAGITIAFHSTNKVGIDEESLLKYIVSYRNHQEFHEPTCERIYQDLFKLLNPSSLTVVCQYTRRGGIEINPFRTNLPKHRESINLDKLLQQ